MKEVILFDIDYTLINSQVSKELRRKKYADFLDITEEDVLLTEIEYVKKDSGFTDFDPNEYIDFIAKNYSVGRDRISEIFFQDDNFISAVYSDVVNTLEVEKKDFSLGIFSEGLEDFQMLKLHKSNLLKYFDPNLTFVFKRKLTEDSLKLLPQKCFIVDDNVFVIEGLCEEGSFRPIWLNRKKDDGEKRVYPVIKVLSDLGAVIRTNVTL